MTNAPLPPGVHVALATPLTAEHQIDVEATRRLVAHVVDGGIHGLNLLGSTGELASLSEPKRRKLVETALDANRGRVPAIAAVAQNNLEDASREIAALARQGIAGALVTVPSYYPTAQPAVEEFYRYLAERSPVPLLIYNIPQFTKISVSPATVAKLARDGVVAGIKDSSRDFEYFSQVVYGTRGVEGFRVFTGSDTMLLASLSIGADGTIAGGPNLIPGIAVQLYRAFKDGALEKAAQLQETVLDLVLATRRGIFPAGIKAGLEILGITRAVTAPPVPSLSPEDHRQLRQAMEKLGLVPAQREEAWRSRAAA